MTHWYGLSTLLKGFLAVSEWYEITGFIFCLIWYFHSQSRIFRSQGASTFFTPLKDVLFPPRHSDSFVMEQRMHPINQVFFGWGLVHSGAAESIQWCKDEREVTVSFRSFIKLCELCFHWVSRSLLHSCQSAPHILGNDEEFVVFSKNSKGEQRPTGVFSYFTNLVLRAHNLFKALHYLRYVYLCWN